MSITYKWPKLLGAMADRLYVLQQSRLAKQREADTIKAEEEALTEHILNTFPKQDLEGARGKLAQVTRKTKEVPAIADWDKFYAYLKKTGEFDLLQRRPHEAAFAARWEAGKTVPGTEKFVRVSLSVSKTT